MSSCAISGCHDATTHKEGYDFSTYTKTINAVKAGSPSNSKLYRVITAAQGSEDFMPPKPYSALSKAATDSIYSWIKRGALNEQCAIPCDTTGTITYAGQIKPIIDLYCSSCHSGTNPSGGIKLATASDIQTVAKSGKLLGAVKRQSGFQAMPPTYALSTCDVRKIALWIKQGYN
jgi:cytochrome c5